MIHTSITRSLSGRAQQMRTLPSLGVSELVDVPNFLVSAFLPLDIFVC